MRLAYLLTIAAIACILAVAFLGSAVQRHNAELSRRGCSTITHVDMYGQHCRWDFKGKH